MLRPKSTKFIVDNNRHRAFILGVVNFDGADTAALWRGFPEWCVGGTFVGDVMSWGISDSRSMKDGLTSILRRIWLHNSAGDKGLADRQYIEVVHHFFRRTDTDWRYAGRWDVLSGTGKTRQLEALYHLVDSLDWLHTELRALKICENPNCRTGLRYFIRSYPREKYCNRLCSGRVKEAQKDARGAVQKLKVPVRSDETRAKMRMAAILREADKRATREAETNPLNKKR